MPSTPGQMIDGMALGETTPGPLIMVLQFVGFLGGWTKAGSLPPLAAATLGAFVAIWTTFVPCFLWIFLGAPYIERWRGRATLTSTLSTVTAAVVGVILNLAVWFALHAVFPSPGAIDWFAVGIAAVSFVGIVKWKWGIIPVIVGAGTGGWLWHLMRS
jgi:chromate transporter